MYAHELRALKRIARSLKRRLSGKIISVHVFGSRVRGDHDVWSDLDVLVVITDKTPEIVSEIISLFVDEELATGIPFSPVIKDVRTFEKEKEYNTSFYKNVVEKGVSL